MNNYKIFRLHLAFLLVIFTANCDRGSHTAPVANAEHPLVIRTTQSPTDGDSREPELTTTPDGRVILSWVEKLGDKRYALRTALLDRNGWSKAQTVAQGDNWFVNW